MSDLVSTIVEGEAEVSEPFSSCHKVKLKCRSHCLPIIKGETEVCGLVSPSHEVKLDVRDIVFLHKG